ncbi:unnamed protein product [Didymodactylos carnosus]|uniref:NAD(P)(+)--arginine ADP-ribosyltransferase n=1 Tax=Didymodactylos carnosus TaxID=1234261 RepID=A0A8S2XLH1_9BILA|nr:unnamed protein product [Didymodactylos carnosus]
MGISHSKTINHNEYDKDKFSDLYKACLENDIDLVQSLVATSSFEMINCYEINGSTALHIAVECGHTEIVRFLLHDYGVFRHLLDSQDRTAFELAQTDEIRQLFHRSGTDGNRFCNEMSLQFTVKEYDEKKNVPCGRVEGHENYRSFANEKTHRLYQQPDSLFMRISAKIVPYKPGNDKFISKTRGVLLSLIDQHIGSTDRQYHKARILIEQYYETGRADSLIRVYTLETPFYKHINQKKETSECLASSIYYSLRFLHSRSFKGLCYRGLGMTMEELKDYQWATEKTSRYLVTNTFCSATRDINVAEGFAKVRAFDQRNPVLIVFNFFSNCWTAIQLEKLSDQLPSISEIEDEREVLILPRSTFRVTKVESELPIAKIYLTYYPLDQELDDYSTVLAQIISEQ